MRSTARWFGRNVFQLWAVPEDVVNEEKHVLALVVTEVLGNGETGKSDTSARARRFVHLAVDEGGLGALLADLDHARLDHLVVQVVACTVNNC